jgi:hypothetical protein
MLAPLAGGQQFRPYMTFYVVEPCIRSKYTDCTDVFQSDVLSEGLSPQTQSSLRLWLLRRADSTGRCNTFAEHFSGCVEAQRLARPLIQLSRNGVELKL